LSPTLAPPRHGLGIHVQTIGDSLASPLEGSGIKRPGRGPHRIQKGLGSSGAGLRDRFFIGRSVEALDHGGPADIHGHPMIAIADHPIKLAQTVLFPCDGISRRIHHVSENRRRHGAVGLQACTVYRIIMVMGFVGTRCVFATDHGFWRAAYGEGWRPTGMIKQRAQVVIELHQGDRRPGHFH
jgi:hypothetical protein